jgi:hypothetical protein
VSPGHLLDAEAWQGHLISVRKSAGGDPEHAEALAVRKTAVNRRLLFVQGVDKSETA